MCLKEEPVLMCLMDKHLYKIKASTVDGCSALSREQLRTNTLISDMIVAPHWAHRTPQHGSIIYLQDFLFQ